MMGLMILREFRMLLPLMSHSAISSMIKIKNIKTRVRTTITIAISINQPRPLIRIKINSKETNHIKGDHPIGLDKIQEHLPPWVSLLSRYFINLSKLVRLLSLLSILLIPMLLNLIGIRITSTMIIITLMDTSLASV